MTTKPLTHLLDTYILPQNMRIIFYGKIYFFIKKSNQNTEEPWLIQILRKEIIILGMRNYKEAIDMYNKIHKSSNYYQEAQYYLGECYTLIKKNLQKL
ncbi:hypothetical protein JRD95_01081 [Rickettsia parkeri]|nr:hypothetical protein JRD95_01081 [Rickettsia parkeri]